MPSIREFKAHLSRYLAEVQTGRVIEITRHRRPVARVIGIPDGAGDKLAAMIACGEAEWSGGKPSGSQIQLSQNREMVSDLVLENRE